MLITYTPDEQNDVTEALYRHVLDCCHSSGIPAVCRTDIGFAIKTGWCREVVTDNLRDMLTGAPSGTVNIYGIRKHGTSLTYQPPKCPGKLGERTAYVDNMLSEFFQLMVECISSTLGESVMKPKRVEDWIYRWRSVSFDREFTMGVKPSGPDIKCLLNADEEDIPKLEGETLWSKNRMFGNIVNIPSSWASSIPIMSYLMYIPRLWGAFYSTPRVLLKLSRVSNRKLSYPPELRDAIGSPRGYSSLAYSSQLWTALTGRLMLPSWFTSCGKEYFWTFTYLLIKCALDKTYDTQNQLEDMPATLYSQSTRGGFKSWCGWYKSCGEAPIWFRDILTNLTMYGVSSILNIDSIVNYV